MSDVDRSDNSQRRSTSLAGTLSASVRRIILLALMTYLMLLAPLAWYQRSLIYHPEPCGHLEAKRSGLPHAVVDVKLKSYDGLDLHGWLMLAGTSSGDDQIDAMNALSNDRPVIIFFPGNAGNRSMRYVQMAVMGSLNVHTLIVDYRGFADNKGTPTEEHFASDARTAWDYLTKELGVSHHRIIIYGESLGGGVATRLASELCQEGIEPGGLIVQSTFNSLVAVAQYHFPIVPVSLLLVDRYPSAAKIPHVTCPVLQIHGSQDSIVPFKFGQRLFDAARAESSNGIAKRQIILPNTDHNDVYSDGMDGNSQLVTGMKSFFDDVANAPTSTRDASNGGVVPAQTKLVPFIDGTIAISALIVLLAAVIWWAVRRGVGRSNFKIGR